VGVTTQEDIQGEELAPQGSEEVETAGDSKSESPAAREAAGTLGLFAVEAAALLQRAEAAEAGPDFLEQLEQYRQRIDAAVGNYSQELLQRVAEEYGPHVHDIVAEYCEILSRGGKRSRGSLEIASYEMFGGTDEATSLQAALVLELLQAAVLVQDDIEDRSPERRGGPAMYRAVEQYHRENGLRGDSAHFGVGQSVNTSTQMLFIAEAELEKLPISPEMELALRREYGRTIILTAYGQTLDMYNAAAQEVTEEEVLDVLRLKTAYYTIYNPLLVGGMLAGASEDELAFLKQYADYTGIAFQVTDDILGTFGKPSETGKSIQDDVREGKSTILTTYAIAHASSEQLPVLYAALGNQDLTTEQFEAYRHVVEETGALTYAQELARQQVASAREVLQEAPTRVSRKGVNFLHGFTEFVAKRIN